MTVDVNELRPITMRLICQEFNRLKIEHEWIKDRPSLVRALINGRWRYMRSCLTELSSPVGVSISGDKPTSMIVAKRLGLTVPDWSSVDAYNSAKDLFSKHNNLVVKPLSGSHGSGVTIGVRTQQDLNAALKVAHQAYDSSRYLVQQQVFGRDIRALVVGGKVVAATERIPAGVVGDGQKNIEELIRFENQNNPLRASGYSTPLNVIDEEAAARFLGRKIYEVPSIGQHVQVVGASNIGLGGTSRDMTRILPKEIERQAEVIANEVGLFVCGVDFIAGDINDSSSYYFIEMNSCPSFGLHIYPSEGDSQPVDKEFVCSLIASIK